MITKIVTSAELHDYTKKGYIIKSEFDEDEVRSLEHKDLVPDDKYNGYGDKPLKLVKQVLEQKVLKIRKFVITLDPNCELARLNDQIEQLSTDLTNTKYVLGEALKSEQEVKNKFGLLERKYNDLNNAFNRENRELLASNDRIREAESQIQRAVKAFGEIKWSEAIKGKSNEI